jgi:hypothetical protein
VDLGLVEGSRELLGGQDVGEVHQRAQGRGHADAVVAGGVGVGGAVDVDAPVPAVPAGGHVGNGAPARQDLPQRADRAMTERGVRTAASTAAIALASGDRGRCPTA